MKQSRIKRMNAENMKKTLAKLPAECEELIQAYKSMTNK
jgi:hypothetical protein